MPGGGGIQRGKNRAGLSGVLVDLPNVSAAKFHGDCTRWQLRKGGDPKPRRGRGGTLHNRYRYLYSGGGGSIDVTKLEGDWPAPALFEGASGTIHHTIHNDRKISVDIMVIAYEASCGNGDDDAKGTIHYVTTGAATFSGWPNSQPTVAAPTKSDLQLWDGTQFTRDPKLIISNGTIAIDWYDTITDSDAGDVGKLDAVIAAYVAPFTGLKLRTGTIVRDAPDGGTITLACGMTNTEDDWVNARNAITVDPKKLTTHGTAAALNSPPSLHTVAGQTIVSRGTTATKLNDLVTGYTTEEGQRSTEDDVEQEGSFEKVDNSGMESDGQKTVVFPFGDSPPADATPVDASLKAVGSTVQELNLDEKKKVTYFDVNSPEEKWLFARLKGVTDPSSLRDITIKGAIFETGSEPVVPTVSGLVYREKTVVTLISPDTSDLSAVLWEFGQTTQADDELFPKIRTETDPQNIDSLKITGAYFTTGSPPGDPGAPSGLKITQKVDLTLTNASASNKSLRLYRYEKQDSLDKIRLPKQKTTVDANFIDDDSIRTKEWLTSGSAPTAPDDPPSNNVKQITYTDVVIYPVIGGTAGLNLRVFFYGARDSRDELVLPNYETITDVSDLKSTAIRAYLNGDSVPSTPSGLQLITTKSRPVTLSLGTNRTVYVLIYAKDTPKQQWEQEHSHTYIDDSAIDSTAESAALDDNTPPIITGGGLIKIGQRSEYVTHDHVGYADKYDTITPAQRVTFPKIETYDDDNDVDDIAMRCELYAVGDSPPAAPSDVPTNNVKIIGKTDLHYNDALDMRVWVYGPADSRDKLILPNFETTTDASGLTSTAVRAYLDGEAVPADPTDMVLRDTKERPITIGLDVDRTLTILIFGMTTHEQDITFRKSKAVAEAGNLEREPEVCYVSGSATPDFSAKNPDGTNLSLYWAVSQQETDSGQWVHVGKFAPLTPTEAMTAQFEKDDVDPASLENESTRVLYNTSATPPADPGIAGKVLVNTNIKRVGKVKWRFIYSYGWRTTAGKLVAEKTETTVDPSGLESKALTAEVWTVGSAPGTPTLSGYALGPYTDFELPNPLYRLRMYRWGLLTTAEEIEIAETLAESDIFGSPSVSGTITREVTVKTCILSDTVASLLATEYATLEAVTARPYQKVQVRKLKSKLKYLLAVDRPADDKKVRCVSHSTGWEYRYLDVSGTYVNVVDAYAAGSGITALQLQPWGVRVVRETVALRRYYRDDHVKDIAHESLLYTRSSADFLDAEAYTIAFVGKQIDYSFAKDGTTRWLAIDYLFERVYTNVSGTYYDMNWSDHNIPRGCVLVEGDYNAGDTPAATTVNVAWVVITLLNSSGYGTAFLS